MTVQNRNELSYMGVEAKNPPNIISINRAPTVMDWQFKVGTVWNDTLHNVVYMLSASHPGAAVWVTVTLPAVQTLSDQTATAVAPVAQNIEFVGMGAINVISGGAGVMNVFGLRYSIANANAVTAAVKTRYWINNGANLCTITLPAVSAVGDVIEVIGHSAGSWQIAQLANQYINLAAATSTVGVAGHADPGAATDIITMVCTTANLGWTITNFIGAPTIT